MIPAKLYEVDNFRFELIRSKRKTVALEVYPDMRVVVRAPLRAPVAFVVDFVKKKSAWVHSKLNHYRENPPVQSVKSTPDFSEGSEHAFLGQTYLLGFRQGSPRTVFVRENQIILVGASFDITAVERQLGKWYRERALEVFQERLNKYYRILFSPNNAGPSNLGGLCIPMPELKVRKMKSRWGSCSQKAVITLSLDLIKKPQICIDYVVVHELCHLVEFNHSPKFYALMSRFMPEWREVRQRLNQS